MFRKPARETATNVNDANHTLPLMDVADLREPLRVTGLFAGIGGIEEGLRRTGHRSDLLCEIDEGASAVLAARFPEAALHHDVTKLTSLPATTQLVTAGFPCQDLSQAGKTKGIAGARSGLVGEVFRLLRKRRPKWVLIENVPFMLHLGRGEAMEVVVAGLESLGYKWAYRVVDSRSFGVPQRRRRVYLLGSMDEDPRRVLYADNATAPDEPGKERWREAAIGFYWTEGNRGVGWAHDAIPTLKGGSSVGVPSAPAIVLRDGTPRVGTPDIRDAERLQGFPADWTQPAETVVSGRFRWKLVGNAVTVGAAEWIGERLRRPGEYDDSQDPELNRKRGWPAAAYDVGDGRRTPAQLSEWPRRPSSFVALDEFLNYPMKPLSERATRGFHSRASKSGLRIPEPFLDLLEAHANAMAAGS